MPFYRANNDLRSVFNVMVMMSFAGQQEKSDLGENGIKLIKMRNKLHTLSILRDQIEKQKNNSENLDQVMKENCIFIFISYFSLHGSNQHFPNNNNTR